jgi:hypothetical protein
MVLLFRQIRRCLSSSHFQVWQIYQFSSSTCTLYIYIFVTFSQLRIKRRNGKFVVGVWHGCQSRIAKNSILFKFRYAIVL